MPVTLMVSWHFGDRKYYLCSLILIVYSIIPFLLSYEKRKPQARELVTIAVMCAIAVASRAAFIMLPHFKPMLGIIMITGMAFGAEAGFLTGALGAFVSNFIFGQGPWTPFQMLTWGIIAMIPGLPIFRKTLRHRIPLVLYGIFAGMAYSWLMDIWTAISWYGSFTWEGYRAALISAIPVVVVYCISNVMFLMILLKPIGEKLERIQIKHGIF